MKILEINYINFRNLEDNNIKLSPRINFFYGKNGQGKTSILEAVYFVCTGKSFRTSKILDLIKYNKTKIGCNIIFSDNISEKNISLKFLNDKKEFFFNRKKITYDEFYGKVNIVTFIPEDIELILGGPNIRRDFFDREIAQGSKEYFNDLKKYFKLLKLRNKYLKEGNSNNELFQVYQDEFIEYGSRVLKKRVEYVRNISILLNLNYRKLFDGNKELLMSYSCFLGEIKKLSLEEIKELFRKSIKEIFFKEQRYGYSLVGPQKDDFIFVLDEKPAKNYSSQGEKKSIIFSLKLSEIDIILKEKKESPIFLIDDIASYFDIIRKENILNYLLKREIQVLISSTQKIEILSKMFEVKKGDVFNGEIN